MPRNINLGYHGLAENKRNIIERMKKHIAADELIQGRYLAIKKDDTTSLNFIGCAVTCIAEEDLKNSKYGKRMTDRGDRIGLVNYLYKRTNSTLNIPYIAPFIDYFHEYSKSMEDPAGGLKYAQKFNIEVLELIDVNIDYRLFVKYLINTLLKGDSKNQFKYPQNVYNKVKGDLRQTSAVLESLSVSPVIFTDLLKRYNEEQKIKKEIKNG